MCDVVVFFFFFSSRRRHTRSLCDWSSDVCSSDLLDPARHVGRPADYRPVRGVESLGARRATLQAPAHGKRAAVGRQRHLDGGGILRRAATPGDRLVGEARSTAARTEERPQNALEQSGLASAVSPDYAYGPL